MRTILMTLSVLTLVAPAGCASTSSNRPTTQSSQAHAECAVCKANADLACVNVAVEKDTPSYAYNGKTYYFCSDECREKFVKKPQKYATK